MSKLSDNLSQNKKVITVEVAPPKGTDCSEFLKNAIAVKEHVTAVNVTDNQRAVMRMTPLVASSLLIKEGIEPIYQITCRDRNRLSIQSDLLGASAMGIQNVLALTGDHVITGDYPQAKPVFDLDSVQLLYTISTLNKGCDLAEKLLNKCTNFYSGAVVNPAVTNVDIHIWRMKEKIRMGAEFFQTQVLFDTQVLSDFVNATKFLNTKIIAGVILVKNVQMAKFLNDNVPGLFVPEWVIKELESTNNPLEAGVKIAAHLVNEFCKIADGVHIMAIRQEQRLPEILKLL